MEDSHSNVINTVDELEFTIFCIENVARRLRISAEKIYDALTQKSDILNEYIVPNYEILHTQDKEYIVDDLLHVMKDEGGGIMRANPILLQKKIRPCRSTFCRADRAFPG